MGERVEVGAVFPLGGNSIWETQATKRAIRKKYCPGRLPPGAGSTQELVLVLVFICGVGTVILG